MHLCAIHTSYLTMESTFIVKCYFDFVLLLFAHVKFYMFWPLLHWCIHFFKNYKHCGMCVQSSKIGGTPVDK